MTEPEPQSETEHDEAMRVAVEAIFDGDHTLFEAAAKKLEELPVEEGKYKVLFGTGHMQHYTEEFTCSRCGKDEVHSGISFLPRDVIGGGSESLHWVTNCPAWRSRLYRWKWQAPVVSKVVRWWHRPGEPRNPLKRKRYREGQAELKRFIEESKG